MFRKEWILTLVAFIMVSCSNNPAQNQGAIESAGPLTGSWFMTEYVDNTSFTNHIDTDSYRKTIITFVSATNYQVQNIEGNQTNISLLNRYRISSDFLGMTLYNGMNMTSTNFYAHSNSNSTIALIGLSNVISSISYTYENFCRISELTDLNLVIQGESVSSTVYFLNNYYDNSSYNHLTNQTSLTRSTNYQITNMRMVFKKL